jgi:hypothetical protein
MLLMNMNIVLFGATGMIGQGVLRECLPHRDVQRVQTDGRTVTGVRHPKLRDVVHADLMSYGAIEADLSPGRRPAAARGAIENGGVPNHLFAGEAPAADAPAPHAGRDHYDRADGPGHVDRRQTGRTAADSAESGHQRRRIRVLMPAPRNQAR